jgi:hypothetical protein
MSVQRGAMPPEPRGSGVTGLVTWRTDDARGIEGARLLLHGNGIRALGRMVRAGGGPADPPFTASYRLDAGDNGRVRRLAVTSATDGRERYLTLNRTDDGFWLLDTGMGSGRLDVAPAVDVDLSFSPLFNTVPIRRLGLHREPGDHTLSMVFVALPDLSVEVVEQRYQTLSPLGQGDHPGEATVGFAWDAFTAEIVVDAEGVVSSYPGVASRIPDIAPASP